MKHTYEERVGAILDSLFLYARNYKKGDELSSPVTVRSTTSQILELITEAEVRSEIVGKLAALDKAIMGAGEYHDDPYEYVVPLRHLQKYRQDLNKFNLDEPIFRETK